MEIRRGISAGGLLSAVCFGLVVFAAPLQADAAALKTIRSSAGSTYTRIVIDLTGTTDYEYAIIPASGTRPARLYVDLKGVSLAGKEVKNIYDYTYILEAIKPGEKVEVSVVREGKRITLEITPGSRQ